MDNKTNKQTQNQHGICPYGVLLLKVYGYSVRFVLSAVYTMLWRNMTTRG